jgi:hypothetical protein
MKRFAVIATAAFAITAAAGATGSKPEVGSARVVVPNVIGFRMDRATRTLHARGLRVNEECSGVFGCIIKARWWVCVQAPRPGRRVPRYSVVVIYGERRGEC